MTLPWSGPHSCEEKMKVQTPCMAECRGVVKLCGYYSQGQQWKSGKITVQNRDGVWWCSMTFDCNRTNTPVAQIRIRKNVIKKLICKSRLIVEFSNGQTFLMNQAKSDKNLRAVTQLLSDLSSGLVEISAPGTPLANAKTNTVTSPTEKTQSESPNFTRMKEPRSKSSWDTEAVVDLVAQDHVEKENTNFSAKKAQSLEFLNRSAEKSRETLKTIGSSSFYSNKTQTPLSDRSYESLSSYSSTKRTPGLMPDPTPSKLPRLSNVSYSWTKNKTPTLSDSKNSSSLQGFSNLGNTCYMNAILQSLFALETFSVDLLLSNRRLLRSLSKESLYHNLSKLLSARKKINVADSVRRDLLRNVKTAISSSAKRFSGYQQHDAHEFLGQVLDQLKEEVVKINKSTPSPNKEASAEELTVTGQEYVNPTIQNFEFEVLHTLKCTECGETVTKTEQFNDLSLDLPQRSNADEPQTIQDALDLFLREEQLEYTCAECGCKQSQVFHSFTRLPRVLIVHLKRYSYSIVGSNNTKMGRSVFIPGYLTLQSFCNQETQPPFQPVIPPAIPPSPAASTVARDVNKEDNKTDVTRRKLDYTGNRNSGTFRRVRSAPSTDSDDETWLALEKKPRLDLSGDIKVPPEDDELVHALEMSLQGSKDNEPEVDVKTETTTTLSSSTSSSSSAKETEELTEEEQIQKVLEISRIEAHQNSTIDMSDLRPENMTEEEMLTLAMERSIMESTNAKSVLNSQEPETTSLKDSCKTYGKSHRLEVMKECSAEVLNSANSDWSKKLCDAELDHSYGRSVSSKSHPKSDFPSGKSDKSIFGSSVKRGSEVSLYEGLDNLALSPMCRNTCDKPSLKGGAMVAEKTESYSPMGKDAVSDGIFSEEDEVVLVKYDPPSESTLLTSSAVKPKSAEELFAEVCDEVDGGRLPEKRKSLSTQTDDDFLVCQEPDDDLEDKENKTPPQTHSSASNTRSDPDWLVERQEQGSKELQEVTTFDLDDEDADIRKAKELSLQELDRQADLQLSEDGPPTQEPPAIVRSKEETESLKKHFEDGHLPYSYKLVSVVSHIGSTSSAGHYISDVYDFKKGEWYSYNDSHVTKTTEAEIRKRRERSGYIFFYMCKNIYENLWLHNKLQTPKKDLSGT
ncbi:ubiquitin carboxyl-terminal hydrolase 37-like [Liolophura sinensis]|uniref:ubiquitin carboxyl-terminal hydrolase 37-like n=1 Tax=Liolophura sinensis TaxID=3198878 RepID=UPI00315910C0